MTGSITFLAEHQQQAVEGERLALMEAAERIGRLPQTRHVAAALMHLGRATLALGVALDPEEVAPAVGPRIEVHSSLRTCYECGATEFWMPEPTPQQRVNKLVDNIWRDSAKCVTCDPPAEPHIIAVRWA